MAGQCERCRIYQLQCIGGHPCEICQEAKSLCVMEHDDTQRRHQQLQPTPTTNKEQQQQKQRRHTIAAAASNAHAKATMERAYYFPAKLRHPHFCFPRLFADALVYHDNSNNNNNNNSVFRATTTTATPSSSSLSSSSSRKSTWQPTNTTSAVIIPPNSPKRRKMPGRSISMPKRNINARPTLKSTATTYPTGALYNLTSDAWPTVRQLESNADLVTKWNECWDAWATVSPRDAWKGDFGTSTTTTTPTTKIASSEDMSDGEDTPLEDMLPVLYQDGSTFTPMDLLQTPPSSDSPAAATATAANFEDRKQSGAATPLDTTEMTNAWEAL